MLSTATSDNTVKTDPLVPIDSVTKEPIIWDGNPAKIEGLLLETDKYLKRNGLLPQQDGALAARVGRDLPRALARLERRLRRPRRAENRHILQRARQRGALRLGSAR